MKQPQESTLWINYLRSFITVLVVFHHANLAYTTFAYFDETTYINSTHPVVDNKRWIGLDILVNFNDIYFMSLMFLIGGLFLTKSIYRKGQKQFTVDRIKRLFMPLSIHCLDAVPYANFEIHAVIKALLTFLISFTLSWILSIQLRKFYLIRKYI